MRRKWWPFGRDRLLHMRLRRFTLILKASKQTKIGGWISTNNTTPELPAGATTEPFVERIKKLDQAGSSLNFDLDLWKGSEVDHQIQSALRSAKWARLAEKIFLFFDIAGLVGDIGFWIYEHVQNVKAEAQLKGYIKDLNVARFTAAQLARINKVWDNSESDMKIAIGSWVDAQKDADAGVPDKCYMEYQNEILALKFDGVFQSLVGNLSLITDRSIFEELQKKDSDRIVLIGHDWLSDDYDFMDLMKQVYGNDYVENPTSPPPATGAGNSTYLPGQPVESLPVGQITGENVAYAELTGGKGALWKIFGYFWSFQELATKANQPGIRHRLSEESRSGSKVVLKLVTSDGKAVSDTNQLLTLDTAANELKWSNGTVLSLDPASKKNLVPTNGWTMFKAYTAPLDSGAAAWVNNTSECNRANGWRVLFTDGSTPKTGLKEMKRNKDSVGVTTWDEPPPQVNEPPTMVYPRVEMDLPGKTMKYYYSSSYTLTYGIDMDLVYPRLGVD